MALCSDMTERWCRELEACMVMALAAGKTYSSLKTTRQTYRPPTRPNGRDERSPYGNASHITELQTLNVAPPIDRADGHVPYNGCSLRLAIHSRYDFGSGAHVHEIVCTRLYVPGAPTVNYERNAFAASATSMGVCEPFGAARKQSTGGDCRSASDRHTAVGHLCRCIGCRRSYVRMFANADPSREALIEPQRIRYAGHELGNAIVQSSIESAQ
eukprot:4469522-Pleurochrysis_carterae.AAC.4